MSVGTLPDSMEAPERSTDSVPKANGSFVSLRSVNARKPKPKKGGLILAPHFLAPWIRRPQKKKNIYIYIYTHTWLICIGGCPLLVGFRLTFGGNTPLIMGGLIARQISRLPMPLRSEHSLRGQKGMHFPARRLPPPP